MKLKKPFVFANLGKRNFLKNGQGNKHLSNNKKTNKL